jgi:sugar phosphate isomerase/epimerase
MKSRLKIAYFVAAPDLKGNERITALQGSLEENFRILSEYGYDGAEIMAGSPELLDIDLLRRCAREYSLEIPVFCTGELFGKYGLSFMAPDESARTRALTVACAVIDQAAVFGATVNVGRLRGRFYADVPRDRSLSWMYAAFERIADHAASLGVGIILEPIAYPFCNVINTTREGIETVRKVGRNSFRLMLDVFTMNMEDPSIEESFVEALPYLDHIHLCDANRLAPGMGKFDFPAMLNSIRAAGYQGYVSVECYQVPDQAQAIARSTEVLMPLIKG